MNQEETMPDYTAHDPKGWCGDPRRGAALGRGSYHADDRAAWEGKLYLRRVRLDSGGYDPNGTYFGIGNPLFWCTNADQSIDFMLRASDRTTAKIKVLKDYPKARFFR